jgi:L-ascorbate metabolism protein UlaG (beta-lactamase superfamily)
MVATGLIMKNTNVTTARHGGARLTRWIGLLCGVLGLQQLCAQRHPIAMKPLGTAGWEINEGGLTILIDPYISRLKIVGESGTNNADDTRKTYARSDIYESDTATIDKVIGKADYIMVTHGHQDHLGDVPYIAKKTGAKVIASDTSCNILRAYGITNEQLYTVKGGEDYQFANFSVKIMPSLHSPLGEKHYFNSPTYTKPVTPPVKISDFTEGGTLMYLVRFQFHTVLVAGSMNYIEREVEGLRPDIILVGANLSRLQIYKYTERLLKATGYPKIVLPTHWDNYRVPYGTSQDRAIAANLRPFIAEVAAASPNSKVIIPIELKTITID